MNRSGEIVSSIIRRIEKSSSSKKLTVKKFYAYQHYLKDNLTDYKGKDLVTGIISTVSSECPCFTTEEQLAYNKVARILIASYL